MLLQIDLLGLDHKDLEWYQMVVRAVIIFIIALAFIRIAGMRSFGSHSAFDVVLSITIGAILGRCITGHYPFFSCLAAAITLASFHRLIAFLSAKSRTIEKLAQGEAVVLFRNGIIQRRNLSLYNITEQDMVKSLHDANLDDFGKVKSMWLECDGRISVVKKEE